MELTRNEAFTLLYATEEQDNLQYSINERYDIQQESKPETTSTSGRSDAEEPCTSFSMKIQRRNFVCTKVKRRVAQEYREPSGRSQILEQIEQSLSSARREITKSIFDFDVRAEKNREKKRQTKVIRKHLREE